MKNQKTFFNSSEEVLKNTKDILEKVEIKRAAFILGWSQHQTLPSEWMATALKLKRVQFGIALKES